MFIVCIVLSECLRYCLTWTRWVHPPFGCMPRPSDWHQLTADSSSWPWEWHKTKSPFSHLALELTHKFNRKVSKEFVSEKMEWGRSWKPSTACQTVPTTDTSKQTSRYKKVWPLSNQSNSNCANYNSKGCRVCSWTIHISALKRISMTGLCPHYQSGRKSITGNKRK